MTKFYSLKECLSFLIGFVIGTTIMFALTSNDSVIESVNQLKHRAMKQTKEIHRLIRNFAKPEKMLYEQEMADKLFEEVRILCWVFTHPANHKTKVPHVRNTWGKRCNKLLFMSIEEEKNAPDIVAIPVPAGRAHLWNKTRLTMKYVYDNHINDADWFMRADDDNFIVVENLRYKLAQYHPQTSLYIGHRFAVDYPEIREGYMAGGGHVFSKKALAKFVTKISSNSSLCEQNDGEGDDLLIGRCLKKHAIFLDARDSKNQKQIFPVGVEEHMKNMPHPDLSYWYWRNLWRNVTQGGLDCCSDVYIGAHYVSPKEMYLLKYLIYFVHPFGLQKNLTEEIPRKLALDEIIKASDAKSFSPNFKEHEQIHFIEDDEKYKNKK